MNYTESSASYAIFCCVSFRQIPPSSASYRLGSHLVRVADGSMSGRQGYAVGGSYLDTPTCHWAEFVGKSADSNDVSAISQIPSLRTRIPDPR